MRFTKIKYDGKQVELAWSEKKKSTEIIHTLSSKEQPDKELPEALNAFAEFVERLCEVPKAWMRTVKVTSISVNVEEKDGRLGLVITSQKKIADANSPLVINTPHLRQAIKLGEEGPGFFLYAMEEAIDRADRAAQGFAAGKRAAPSLFDSGISESKSRELAGATAE
jgi:hypothetical protein